MNECVDGEAARRDLHRAEHYIWTKVKSVAEGSDNIFTAIFKDQTTNYRGQMRLAYMHDSGGSAEPHNHTSKLRNSNIVLLQCIRIAGSPQLDSNAFPGAGLQCTSGLVSIPEECHLLQLYTVVAGHNLVVYHYHRNVLCSPPFLIFR